MSVRLTPKGGADRIEGSAERGDGTRVLLVRVKAAAEKGAANAALEKLLAHAFGVATSRVTVASGYKTRRKTVCIAGDPQALREKLDMIEKSKNRR